MMIYYCPKCTSERITVAKKPDERGRYKCRSCGEYFDEPSQCRSEEIDEYEAALQEVDEMIDDDIFDDDI